MSRMVGTVSRGIRAPIIRNGDNLVEIVTNSILEAAADDGFVIQILILQIFLIIA